MTEEVRPNRRRGSLRIRVGAAVLFAALVVAAVVLAIALTGHNRPRATSGLPTASAQTSQVASSPPSGSPPDSAQHDCSDSPHTCGYPDATNTGVTPGTKLTNSGCIDATKNNQVIENVALTNCTIDVKADNVTIRNVKIVTSNDGGTKWAIIVRPGASANIDNVDVSGVNLTNQDLQYAIYTYGPGRTTVRTSNLHSCADCLQGPNITAVGNYIHDVNGPPGAHRDGFQCLGEYGCGLIAVNNTITVPDGGAAIAIRNNFGTPTNCTVTDNLLAGGSYTVYGGGDTAHSAGSKSTNIHINDNRFSRMYYPTGGLYGPLAYFSADSPGNTFSGNIWDDTGKPVTA